MTLTNPYSFDFGGYEFGGAGNVHQIVSIDGLEGLPDLRVQDDNRGYLDGMWTGRDFYGARVISMMIQTFAGGGNTAQENYQALKAALLPQQYGTTTLKLFTPPYAFERRIEARVRVNETTLDPEFTYGFITTRVDFYCPDPRIYSETLYTETGDSISLSNAGTVTSPYTITIDAPSGTDEIFADNGYMKLNGATLTVVIDLLNRTITEGGAPARNLLDAASVWIEGAVPGSSAVAITGASSMSIAWRDAYL